MSSPYDNPYGKFYTSLSAEYHPSSLDPVFMPQFFREHIVLVLGWTSGRQGYVSIVTITPNIPDGSDPAHYLRIRTPHPRSASDEGTVTLRKNKTASALVEHSYVRLDLGVCEVPVAMLSAVPRTGMQLMLRAGSMEKIMCFLSCSWGWGQVAWGQTGRFPLEHLHQWVGDWHNPNACWGLSQGSIGRGEEAGYSHTTTQPLRKLSSGSASQGFMKKDGDTEDEALVGRSGGTDSWTTAHRLDNDGDGHSKEKETRPCARQEMVYAGDAHCAALAKLLQDARSRSCTQGTL